MRLVVLACSWSMRALKGDDQEEAGESEEAMRIYI